jgi:hypothetical protein
VYEVIWYASHAQTRRVDPKIPEFKWHIIKENEPFRVEGLDFDITPIAVHHGRLFTDETDPLRHMPNDSPERSGATTPSRQSPAPGSTNPAVARPIPNIKSTSAKPRPYICLGFIFWDFMVYISDVSYIPEDVWEAIRPSTLVSDDWSKPNKLVTVPSSLNLNAQTRRFKVLVVDCLRLQPHTSHFGIQVSMSYVGSTNYYYFLNAVFRTLLTQPNELTHKEHIWLGLAILLLIPVSLHLPVHALVLAADAMNNVSDWETIGKYLEGKQLTDREMKRQHISEALQVLPPQQDGDGIWIRPAYDGLRLFANDTDVWEDQL